ncbi:MAG: FAD-linked oxidase C-terminal domain-containing protein [Phycisphaerales bacterium]
MTTAGAAAPPHAGGTPPGVDEIERGLRRAGCRDVRTRRHDRLLYATDASLYQVEPLAVVVPGSVEEAEAAVRWCLDAGVPVLPRGAGTALAGQSVNRAVIVDMSAGCRRILEISAAERRARVEPGVVLDQLNAALQPHGLMFGPDVATSSHANLGGMIGNNSAGAWSLRYGRTVEHLVALDALLADGSRMVLREGACRDDPRQRRLADALAAIVLPAADEIRRRVPDIRRHVDGYNVDLLLNQMQASTPGLWERVNLAHLLCGSEGTLGVTLGAELALVPRPRARGLAIVGFDSVDHALQALVEVLGTAPVAVELVDDVVIGAARMNPEYAGYVRVLPGEPQAVLYVEYAGDDDAEVRAGFDRLAALLPARPRAEWTDPAAREEAWRLRKAGEPLLHAIPGIRKPVTFVEDTAVDPARLRSFVQEFRAIVERHGTTAAYWAHASVGCLHIRPMLAPSLPEDRARMVAIAEEVADLVVRYGGALSGEHGDGRVRSPLLPRVMGPVLMECYRSIKRLMDPANLLNPGNVVGGPEGGAAILQNLRVLPELAEGAAPPEPQTFMDWSRQHGLLHAAEQCNGAGLCRRMAPGTMCPSFRATRDERHATRGRANAMRLALTGQLIPERPDGAGHAASGRGGAGAGGVPWSDPELAATLDLCLGCKACRRECPSNVDLARLKAEFTAQRYAAEGRIPRKAAFLGRIRRSMVLGSRFWPLANALGRSRVARQFLSWWADLDPRRSIPEMGPSLRRRLAAEERARRSGHPSLIPPQPDPGAPAVVLLPDCFSAYSESTLGAAAVRLLRAFGYRVVIPDAGCCGRSLISNGLLREAASTARATARALLAAMEEHRAVALLGAEPSCLGTVVDEWRDLRLDVPAAALGALASGARLVDDFLHERWSSHPRIPAIPELPDEVILHGHCHQKALWGPGSGRGLLERLFPGRVRVLDAGCCGMAGGFGVTSDHYELSVRIAELELLPALRARPDAVVCAAGTSCRHQIRDLLGVEALHPVDVAARVVVGASR